jgi:hypothetical protein
MVREAGQNPRIAACPSTHVCSSSATLRCDVRLPVLACAYSQCRTMRASSHHAYIAIARDCSRQISSSHSCTRCDTVACGRKMQCVYMWLLRPRAPRPLTPISCAQNQSIVNERTFATWPDFFNHTTIDVAPFGHCECLKVYGGRAISFENRSVVTDCSASRPSFAPPSRHLLSG